MNKVVGLGAGGHASVVLDILLLMGEYEPLALLDSNPETWGTEVLGVPVVGGDELLSTMTSQAVSRAFMGIGSAASTELRRRLFLKAKEQGLIFVNAIHPEATIAASADYGEGIAVMAKAVINSCARLGRNVVVNTSAVVEHDCVLDDHVFIATGALLGGGVHVGEGAHVGIGASIRQGIRIGKNSVVGAGAVVVHDVPDGIVVVGVPARILKAVEACG